MTDDQLIERALAAKARSYSPYSRFAVGSAVVAGGRVYEGANVENASYGLAVCAERAAIVQAVLDGARVIDTVAVASDASPPSAPCGMCRQTMAEFAPEPEKLRVILVNAAGERTDHTLAELLPHAFRPEDLGR